MEERIKLYRDSKALSQSDIKLILSWPANYREKKEKETFTDGLLIGEAVDIYLTQGRDVYESKYAIIDMPQTGAVKDILIYAAEKIKTKLLESEEAVLNGSLEYDALTRWTIDGELISNSVDLIMEAAKELQYQPNWKEETLKNKLCTDENVLTFVSLVENMRKTILPYEVSSIIDEVVASFIDHEHTKNYFDLKDEIAEGKIDVLSQVPLYFKYRDVECKALLDMVIINDTEEDFVKGNLFIPAKSVMPIDIKTTGEYTTKFSIAVKRFRYDIQAAWYTLACESNYNLDVLPFRFIVESTREPGCPLVYEVNREDLMVAKWGAEVYGANYSLLSNDSSVITPGYSDWANRYYVYGYEKAIEDFKWYMETGNWDYSREIYQSGGLLQLDLYGSKEQDSPVFV